MRVQHLLDWMLWCLGDGSGSELPEALSLDAGTHLACPSFIILSDGSGMKLPAALSLVDGSLNECPGVVGLYACAGPLSERLRVLTVSPVIVTSTVASRSCPSRCSGRGDGRVSGDRDIVVSACHSLSLLSDGSGIDLPAALSQLNGSLGECPGDARWYACAGPLGKRLRVLSSVLALSDGSGIGQPAALSLVHGSRLV